MNRRRGLLCAVLVYVALDLSLPGMPGAFVFAPEDSVEGLQGARGRDAVVALPSHGVLASRPSRPRVENPVRRGTPRRGVASQGPVAHCLPRATLDPAPPSEDPQ